MEIIAEEAGSTIVNRLSMQISVLGQTLEDCLVASGLGKRERLRHSVEMTNQRVTTQSSSVTRTRPRGLDKYRTSQ